MNPPVVPAADPYLRRRVAVLDTELAFVDTGAGDPVVYYAEWLAKSPIPKLFVNADPGVILTGAQREFCRRWPNQQEVTVRGSHFVQEDSPAEIGRALAAFVGRIRP
jgi:pimeloyl-ACP methyl ester carboxylesterase